MTRQRGSAIALVLFMLTLLMLEVSVLGFSLTRSVGSEGILVTQNMSARRGIETAFTRLTNSLNGYVAGNGLTNVDTAFASAGASAISNTVLTTTNPETGRRIPPMSRSAPGCNPVGDIILISERLPP